MSVFPNKLLSLFSIPVCSCSHRSLRSLFVTIGSGTWLTIIQPCAHICQFHGFYFVQLAYAYRSFYCLLLFKFLSLYITILSACSAFYSLKFSSIQMASLETLKSWEGMKVKSWNNSALNSLKRYIFFLI